jgi:hypothetical protein
VTKRDHLGTVGGAVIWRSRKGMCRLITKAEQGRLITKAEQGRLITKAEQGTAKVLVRSRFESGAEPGLIVHVILHHAITQLDYYVPISRHRHVPHRLQAEFAWPLLLPPRPPHQGA